MPVEFIIIAILFFFGWLIFYLIIKNAIKNGINESYLFYRDEQISAARHAGNRRISDAERIAMAEERIAQLTAELASYGWTGEDENPQESKQQDL